MTTALRRRAGFTLVEMLVASALIIFMMYIITSAFESGLSSFRILKVQGDMQEKLRQAATVLRMDLASPHFGGDMSPLTQGPFLTDHRLTDQTWVPPQKGYFRICLPPFASPQLPLAFTPEGVDPDSPPLDPNNPLRYYRVSDPSALYLQFTVNLTDGHPATRDARGRRDQFVSTNAAGLGGMTPWSRPDYNIADVPFASNWYEVAYFLQPNGQTTDGTMPLYTLFRRQKMLVEPNPTAAAWVSTPVNQNDPLVRRLSPAPTNPTPTYPPGYPPATFPRFLRDQAPLETDRDFPDVGSWWTGQTDPRLQYAFNSPADVTEPVRRWGMSLPNWTSASNNPPWPAAFGQLQSLRVVPPNAQPQAVNQFNPILEDARLGTPANPYADPAFGPRIGGDVLLTDVVNVEVKVLWEPVRLGTPNTDRFDTTQAGNFTEPAATGNPDYPFDRLALGANRGINDPSQLPNVPRVFDTWSANNDPYSSPPPRDYNYGVPPTVVNPAGANPPIVPNPDLARATSPADPNYSVWNTNHFVGGRVEKNPAKNIPLRVRVRALQIKLRIWDKKTNQTRQVTIIQDL